MPAAKKKTAKRKTAKKRTTKKTAGKKTAAKKTTAKKKTAAKKKTTAKSAKKKTAKKPSQPARKKSVARPSPPAAVSGAPNSKAPNSKAPVSTEAPDPLEGEARPRKKALISKGNPAVLVPYRKERNPQERTAEQIAEGGALTWHSAPSVPQAIRASFGEAIEFAKVMADRAEDHPTLSIHEFRKTTRRLRALVKLLRGVISRDAARSLDTGLRSAVLPTSGLRDARILLSTLDRLPKIPKSKSLRRELVSRFEERIDAIDARGDEARVLTECCKPFARLPGELADALPAVVSAEELRTSVRRSYRRARRSCLSAVRVPEDAAIHRGRKRVKELRYQLEWLLEISEKRVKKRQKRVAALAQDLGEVTDLLVLEEAILDERDSLDGLGATRFCRRLRTILLARFDEIASGIEELFEESAGVFSKGVADRLR